MSSRRKDERSRRSLGLNRADFVDQGAAAYAELFRGMGAVAAAFFQRGENRCPLDLREPACGDAVFARHGGQGSDLGREMFGHDDVAAAKQTCSLDGIAKLADVAGPAVGQKALRCLR